VTEIRSAFAGLLECLQHVIGESVLEHRFLVLQRNLDAYGGAFVQPAFNRAGSAEESTSWTKIILMVQGSVSHTPMAASSAGVSVSASLIQKAWAMVTSPSAPWRNKS